jgi:hypothetical protein
LGKSDEFHWRDQGRSLFFGENMGIPDREPDLVVGKDSISERKFYFEPMLVSWYGSTEKLILLDGSFYWKSVDKLVKFAESQSKLQSAYKKWLISKAIKEKLK